MSQRWSIASRRSGTCACPFKLEDYIVSVCNENRWCLLFWYWTTAWFQLGSQISLLVVFWGQVLLCYGTKTIKPFSATSSIGQAELTLTRRRSRPYLNSEIPNSHFSVRIEKNTVRQEQHWTWLSVKQTAICTVQSILRLDTLGLLVIMHSVFRRPRKVFEHHMGRVCV